MATWHRTMVHALGVAALCVLSACGSKTQTTSVGRSVATLFKMTGAYNPGGCAAPTTPAPNAPAWFNALPPTNKTFPFAGFELWAHSTPGCGWRLDLYRAL